MLLDTSGLFSYHSIDEPNHAAAVTLFEAAGQKLTHSYVLSEFVALTLARGLARQPALRFVRTLLRHPEIRMAWVDETLHDDAMLLLEARIDKAYSLCDAVSFVLMRQQNIVEALTTDRHFEQEGFRRLL